MKTKHTPKPWYCTMGYIVGRTTNQSVAEVVVDEDNAQSDEEISANRDLIAAAPDLAEALWCLINICTHPKASKADMKRIALEARDVLNRAIK